ISCGRRHASLALVFICGIVVIGVQFSIALGFLPDPG
ncbi:hypothetical protein LTSEMIN_2083, partial [Salmonella enterica subsp. enterica serovar Minnesota str. A4-603]